LNINAERLLRKSNDPVPRSAKLNSHVIPSYTSSLSDHARMSIVIVFRIGSPSLAAGAAKRALRHRRKDLTARFVVFPEYDDRQLHDPNDGHRGREAGDDRGRHRASVQRLPHGVPAVHPRHQGLQSLLGEVGVLDRKTLLSVPGRRLRLEVSFVRSRKGAFFQRELHSSSQA
jgi:hypothetical protein